MPSTQPAPHSVALQSLRQPIHAFAPRHAADEHFQASMLDLADLLEQLWSDDEDETLESDIIWTVLYAFPALTVTGPTPEELVDLTRSGFLIDAETADTLRTLGWIRRILDALEPRGFAAALWRDMLLAIYRMVEHFVLIDEDLCADRCFQLLDTAEALADKFSGAA